LQTGFLRRQESHCRKARRFVPDPSNEKSLNKEIPAFAGV
jgi:hypothetical protein